eukprot:9607126-Lingulodinium_polyedra.AAC.1
MEVGEEQAEEAYVAMAHRAKTWKQNKQFKQQLHRDRPSRDRPRLEGQGTLGGTSRGQAPRGPGAPEPRRAE